jgi:hypothetical protein
MYFVYCWRAEKAHFGMHKNWILSHLGRSSNRMYALPNHLVIYFQTLCEMCEVCSWQFVLDLHAVLSLGQSQPKITKHAKWLFKEWIWWCRQFTRPLKFFPCVDIPNTLLWQKFSSSAQKIFPLNHLCIAMYGMQYSCCTNWNISCLPHGNGVDRHKDAWYHVSFNI